MTLARNGPMEAKTVRELQFSKQMHFHILHRPSTSLLLHFVQLPIIYPRLWETERPVPSAFQSAMFPRDVHRLAYFLEVLVVDPVKIPCKTFPRTRYLNWRIQVK